MGDHIQLYKHLSGLSLAHRLAIYSNSEILPTTPPFIRDYGIKQGEVSFWRIQLGFQIREVDPNLFIITFRNVDDFNWISSNGPWYPFGNSLRLQLHTKECAFQQMKSSKLRYGKPCKILSMSIGETMK